MLLHEFNWKKEVLQAKEPVLVDFWASWCGPCQALNPVIAALAKDVKVCKVDVDTNKELATHYGISSIPALLIFKAGQVAARGGVLICGAAVSAARSRRDACTTTPQIRTLRGTPCRQDAGGYLADRDGEVESAMSEYRSAWSGILAPSIRIV